MKFSIEDHKLLLDGKQITDLPRLPTSATVTVWSVPTEYRPSGYFVAAHTVGQPPELPACRIGDTHLLSTLELNPDVAASVAAARTERFYQLNEDAELMLSALDATYPGREVLTWDQQVKDAEALQVNADAPCEMLRALAAARGIDIMDLAGRVLAKSVAYKIASGRILGARQFIEIELDAAQTIDAILTVPTLAQRLGDVS